MAQTQKHYESLEALLATQNNRIIRGGGYGRSPSTREGSKRNDWSGTASLEEAFSLARNGWKEGRANISNALNVAHAVTKNSNAPNQSLDVAGAFPFIPAAVAGDPMNMWSPNPADIKTKPVIRLYHNICYSAVVPAKNITNIGGAMLGVVDQLESSGFRTEIVAYWGSYEALITVLLKEASEPLNLDALAFPMAHPAMLRRINFFIRESEPTLPWEGVGMGYPKTIEPEFVLPNSVVIPANIGGNEGATVEGAVAYIQRLVKASPWGDAITFE